MDSTAPASAPRFEDGKEPGALRTIGEVAKALGLRQHVLRYWEEQFPTLRPLTRAGGRRYYRPEDIALLAEIDRLLHREGYTIRGARLALQGGKALAAVEQMPPASAGSAGPEEDQIVAAIQVLRSHLEAIRARLAEAIAE